MSQTFLSNRSRYLFRPLILEEVGNILRLPAFRGIKNTDFPNNITIRPKSSDRLDLISFSLYGTTRFDWVLATFNNMKFPLEDIKSAEILIAPSKETLFNEILPKLQLELEAFL